MKKILIFSLFLKLNAFNLKYEYKKIFNYSLELGINKEGAQQAINLIERLRLSIKRTHDLDIDLTKLLFFRLNSIFSKSYCKECTMIRRFRSYNSFFELITKLILDIYSETRKIKNNAQIESYFINADISLIKTISRHYEENYYLLKS